MGENGLFIEKPSFQPSAHPCGECVEYSIYGACWREGGCGVDPCEYQPVVDVDTCNYDAPLKFVFTSTKIAKILYGPHAAPADGTLTTTTLIDHEIVAGPSSQEVLEDVEYTVEYVPEEDLCFTSGWHAIKVYAEWKDGEGVVIQSEQRTVCVYAAIRPAGEDAIQLHDVRILPGFAGEVCIDENLKFVRMLGPYRSHADADYVLERWGDTITTWAEKCLCPNTCVGAEKMGGWNDDGPFAVGETDITAAAVGYANQDWLDCLPMDIPLYVDLNYICGEPQDGISIYLTFYDADDDAVGEIELGYEYSGTFIVPPCQYVKVIVSNDTGDVWPPKFSGLTLPFNFASNYANAPLPSPPWDVDTESECPIGSDISDLVPSKSEALLEWLAENPPEE